jgi:hypothetical protein
MKTKEKLEYVLEGIPAVVYPAGTKVRQVDARAEKRFRRTHHKIVFPPEYLIVRFPDGTTRAVHEDQVE